MPKARSRPRIIRIEHHTVKPSNSETFSVSVFVGGKRVDGVYITVTPHSADVCGLKQELTDEISKMIGHSAERIA